MKKKKREETLKPDLCGTKCSTFVFFPLSFSVVSVGGDGMFSEVMNGLLSYENSSHGASFNGHGKQLIVGIIPAGWWYVTRHFGPLETWFVLCLSPGVHEIIVS